METRHSKLTNAGISNLRKRIIRLKKVTLGLARFYFIYDVGLMTSRIEKLTDTGIVSLSKGVSKMIRVSELHIDISEYDYSLRLS